MIELSMEQEFQLRQLRLQLEEMDRDDLVAMVLEERADFLIQGNFFREMMRDAGIHVEEEMDMSIVLPENEEEMIAQFGYRPSDEEVAELISTRIEACQEAARMDVDIEAIALGLDEEL